MVSVVHLADECDLNDHEPKINNVIKQCARGVIKGIKLRTQRSDRRRQSINLRLQTVQEQKGFEDAARASRAARRVRALHQKLEREDDVRRRPAPQLLARPRRKLGPPLWWRHGIVLRSVALHAPQLLGRAQRLPCRVPAAPMQLEQAVVRVRGDVPQVLAEGHVDHSYA